MLHNVIHVFITHACVFKMATVNGLPVLTNYKHYITHNAAQQEQVHLGVYTFFPLSSYFSRNTGRFC